MTATIIRHPRTARTTGAFPAAFGSAAGPGFQWGAPAAPARPAEVLRLPRPAAEIVQPARRAGR